MNTPNQVIEKKYIFPETNLIQHDLPNINEGMTYGDIINALLDSITTIKQCNIDKATIVEVINNYNKK